MQFWAKEGEFISKMRVMSKLLIVRLREIACLPLLRKRLRGGGIYNSDRSKLLLINSTIAENTADSGGGLWNDSTVYMSHTVLGNNLAVNGFDCESSAVINSLGHNVVESATQCPLGGVTVGNQQDLDPQLESLSDDGLFVGFIPLDGSPLIDAGDVTGCPDATLDLVENGEWLSDLSFDQRGYYRVIDGDNDARRCVISVQLNMAVRLRFWIKIPLCLSPATAK